MAAEDPITQLVLAARGAIVGVRSAQQVSGIAGAADIELSAEDGREIERELMARAV